MATEQYKVAFSAPPAKILADIKAIRAAFLDLDKVIDRTQAKCHVFASRAAANFKTIGAAATQAGTAVTGMGGNNAALQVLEAQLKAVRRDLDGVKTSAGGAAAAAGGMGGGAGGSRAAGVARKPGFIQTAMDVKATADMAIGLGRTAANLTAGTVSDQADKVREYFGTSAQKAAQFQQDMRSWASLTGRNGVNAEAARQVFDFARAAGVPVAEAGQFLDRFEGSGQLGIEKGNLGGKVGEGGLTKAAQDRLKIGILGVASQFGNRVGLDPQIAADVAAGVIQHNKIADVGQFAGITAGLHYGVDQGKGDMGTLVRAALGAGATEIPSGRLSGLPEAGAWMGVWSSIVGKEGQVDEAHRQATRLLNTSGKEGGADYLRSIGVDKAGGTLAKMNLLAGDIKAKGITDVAAFLTSKGFGASEEIRSVEAMLPQLDTLNARVAESQKRSGNGADVLAANAANQVLPLVEGKRAQAGIEANEIEQGYIQQSAENALAAAKMRLTKPLPGGGNTLTNRSLGEMYGDKMASFRTWMRGGGSMEPEEILIQQQAMQSQIAAAQAVGIDLTRPPEGYGLGNDDKPNFAVALAENLALPPQEFSRQFAANQAQIDARRAAAAQALRQAAGALDAMGPQGGADAGPAAGPAVDPKRR